MALKVSVCYLSLLSSDMTSKTLQAINYYARNCRSFMK